MDGSMVLDVNFKTFESEDSSYKCLWVLKIHRFIVYNVSGKCHASAYKCLTRTQCSLIMCYIFIGTGNEHF